MLEVIAALLTLLFLSLAVALFRWVPRVKEQYHTYMVIDDGD
jgi:hypothetical protein